MKCVLISDFITEEKSSVFYLIDTKKSQEGKIIKQATGASPKNAIPAMIQGGTALGFFDFFKQSDINQGVENNQKDPNAVLPDVRTPQEYREGHIPGSIIVPLQTIDKVKSVAENKDTVLYVCCNSGARSRQAVSHLQHMGYTTVNNIGSIAAYSRKAEC